MRKLYLGIIAFAMSSTAFAAKKQYAKGLIVPKDAEYGVPFLSMDRAEGGLPEKYDLRELGLVTSVKNQGSCGSCWAFAGTAAMESALLKQSGATFNLSEQELVSCDTSAYGCSGGWQPFNYMVNYGVTSEEMSPYKARNMGCKRPGAVAKAMKWGNVGVAGRRATVDEVRKAVVDFGALWITVGANSYWSNPSSTISRCSNTQVNHAVTVAGYEPAATAGKFNFIIKNSWGTSWNGDGYAKSQLGCNNLGATVSFVVPEDSVCAPPEFGLAKKIVLRGASEVVASGLEEAGLSYSWQRVGDENKRSGVGAIQVQDNDEADYVVKTRNACGTWTMLTRVVSKTH